MKPLTSEQLEDAARRLCEQLGENPNFPVGKFNEFSGRREYLWEHYVRKIKEAYIQKQIEEIIKDL